MFDKAFQRLTSPLWQRAGRRLAQAGVSANALTFTGFGVGLLAAGSIAAGHYRSGLALILVSRLMDGLDGAVARATQPTDRGAFLDITLDFLFYAAIPLAFAVANPAVNALAAAVLLAAFMGTGSSFLAFAVLAEKARHNSHQPELTLPRKGFYFLGGLTEATETITVFAAMCIWPQHFAALAYGFAALCAVTTGMRVWWGWRRLGRG